MKTRIQFILSVFTLFFLGLLPKMQAALPPEISGNPDGCYPAFTTAEGCNALSLLGSGIGNTGVGWCWRWSAGPQHYRRGFQYRSWRCSAVAQHHWHTEHGRGNRRTRL